MKPLLLIPALFLAACASRAPHPITVPPVTPPSRPVSTAALRTPEQVREYRFGRYVDPGEPLAMHESHPVYRVETSAGWDLRPGSKTPPASRSQTASPSVSANDAVVAEVHKQRVATRAFTEQSARLTQQLAAMQRATAQVDELAKQNLALKGELKVLKQRMDTSDAREREQKPAAAGQQQPRTEDKW